MVYNGDMDKMNLLPENEYSEFESRRYINPNLTVEATDSFIDKLRATQQANAQQTAQQTAVLGTDVPSNEGGLMGAGSYWSSRYATPQNSALVADLRATAQAKALNDALSNEQAMWQKRYTEAYRAYQKRQHDKENKTTDPYATVPGDEPDYETTTPEGTSETSLSGIPGATTVVDIAGNLHIGDMNTGDSETIAPGKTSKIRGSAAGIGGGEIRTLPNGNKVWIKPGYGLVKEDGKYYLVNESTGARTEVGGY